LNRQNKTYPRDYYKNAEPGTLEHYRHLYMTQGFKVMVIELEKLYCTTQKGRLQEFIQAILYGVDKNGVPNDKPEPPNPRDMLTAYDQYRFMELVYHNYQKSRSSDEE